MPTGRHDTGLANDTTRKGKSQDPPRGALDLEQDRARPILRALLLALLAGTYLYFLATPIDLSVADLGRHLKNGELFLSSFTIPHTNLYSYTFPDFPFVNHHWGTGVLFALIRRLVGYTGLHVFSLAMSMTTFLLCFRLAWRKSSFEAASVIAMPLIAILITRTEIRPETFSYLLATVFLWILWDVRDGILPRRALFALPPLTLLWVNLHIYFFLALVLMGLFLGEAWIVRQFGGASAAGGADKGASRQSPAGDPQSRQAAAGGASLVTTLAIVLGLSMGLTLLNPSGLRGVLYPLRIFENYGQAISENQSLFWVAKHAYFPAALYFKIACVVLVLAWVWGLVVRRSASIALLALSATIAILGWQAIRNFGLFGYLALPLTAAGLRGIDAWLPRAVKRPIVGPTLFAVVALALFVLNPQYWTVRGPVGIGLAPRIDGAARFFEEHALHGPIFNNYDVGGYLIGALYPRERVFVDNRPEAYPAVFFSETYGALQESEAGWRSALGNYKFNAIVLSYASLVERTRNFLALRGADPEWATIFADGRIVILARRDGPDRAIVADYELCLWLAKPGLVQGARPAASPVPPAAAPSGTLPPVTKP